MEKMTQVQVRQAMDKVLEVRYSDFELERALCMDLLEWGQEQADEYVIAFARTYLGDYFIAKGEITHCATHLMEARDLATDGGYNDLLSRIYILLGIYYENIADEQSSLQCNMDGIMAARKVGDIATEGLILNNIASNFQRQKGYEQALRFYKEAYELIRQSGDDRWMMNGLTLSNLAMVSINLGRMEEAEAYIRQCEKMSGDFEVIQILCTQNWCQYYAATGNADQAWNQADYLLSMEERISENRFYAFDIYAALFDSMMLLHKAPAALRFLNLMEECCADTSPDQLRRLEEGRMAYCLEFEKDDERQAAAYRHYCQQARKLRKMSAQAITNGLKSTIQLFQVARQKEKLSTERRKLKSQVNRDELTQVYTRRYLEELIQQYENSPLLDSLGFIMIDVDCLKEYNDTYGHPAGDEVLRGVGECLRLHAVDTIFPCRFGGDEFACLCAGLPDEDIIEYLNLVREDLQKRDIPHRTSRCAQRVTLSIGFSNEPVSSGLSVRTLLEWADKALYGSKINGRNTYSKHGE